MAKGICCAGNILVDITYPIEAWPKRGELTHILEGIHKSTGGSVCNTIIDLAKLDPSLPLVASGCAGHDEDGDFVLSELGKYPNIDLSMIQREGRTSFTAVMSDAKTKERTFFYHAGGIQSYNEEMIDLAHLNTKIFHIGYILLLPGLDQPDEIYGTKMARLLHHAKTLGMETSVDTVSQTGEQYKTLFPHALRYADYCIINELEAQQITGILLRTESGALLVENLPKALSRLKEMGVARWAVIHCPELGCGMDPSGTYCEISSLQLPGGYIKGSVGAGDAFCAGVLYGASQGWTLWDALWLGNCTAAGSLSQMNASDGVGSVAEMLKLGKRYQK